MSKIHTMPGHLIRRLHQISQSVFHTRMQELGLDLTPVQFAALSELAAQGGVDQATLAGRIAYDRVTLGGVIDRLEAKGLVTREISPTDRRARMLALSPKGAELLSRITDEVEAIQPAMLSGLTPDEQRQFIALAAKAAEGANSLSRAPMRTSATRRVLSKRG